MLDKVRQMKDIAATSGLSLLEIAMRFCVSNLHAAVTIPGVRTPEQARSNAAASTPLSSEVVEMLRRLA
jgi:aryl-alcohol dehydrogenase-like predicted oxidoreductase